MSKPRSLQTEIRYLKSEHSRQLKLLSLTQKTAVEIRAKLNEVTKDRDEWKRRFDELLKIKASQ